VHGGDEQIADHLEGYGGSLGEAFKMMYQGPMRFADDVIVMNLQSGTQWDALSHVWYDHKMYNGFPASAVTGLGATKNGIERVAERGQVVTRGVLLDVAGKNGLKHLAPNTIVTPDELDATCKAQNIAVEQGDVVLVRTGWWGRFLETRNGEAFLTGSPGLSWRCAEWLHAKKAAAVAVDNVAVEVAPAEIEGTSLLFHMLALREMGMMLGEIWALDELAADCAQDKVYEFMLVAQPLLLPGAVGSPVAPLAIK
jgi:kynurenine formamidase